PSWRHTASPPKRTRMTSSRRCYGGAHSPDCSHAAARRTRRNQRHNRWPSAQQSSSLSSAPPRSKQQRRSSRHPTGGPERHVCPARPAGSWSRRATSSNRRDSAHLLTLSHDAGIGNCKRLERGVKSHRRREENAVSDEPNGSQEREPDEHSLEEHDEEEG